MRAYTTVRLIKILHTAVWALFAGAILAIPPFAWANRRGITMGLIGLVLVECAILAVNGMQCPLTAVAARYTTNRRDNFDIYLPVWLARHNKQIFGGLFLAAVLFAVLRFTVMA